MIKDLHSTHVLQFPELLAMLARYARTGPARQLILGLAPVNRPELISAKHGLYSDTQKLARHGADMPPFRLPANDDALRRAEPEGAVADGLELLQCRMILDSADMVRRFVDSEACAGAEHLAARAAPLDPLRPLRAILVDSIDEDGQVLDTASAALGNLRRDIHKLEDEIQRRLDNMLQAAALDTVLQERFVTIRNNRFVVPVKREMKNRLPGIVHDHSDSGRTLFIEPAQTVNQGNELASLKLQERDEVRRVLTHMTALVRQNLPAFRLNLEILAELDAAAAVGTWAAEFDCTIPAFGKQLRLVNARHPLLEKQFRDENAGRRVVPLELQPPRETRAIAITGSNSGGKTVVLKTTGLIVLAAQAGLPVPVDDRSVLELFFDVHADIGDEQSLAQNLSTFTGHLSNINRILDSVRRGGRRAPGTPFRRALVLLDELGAGTDPVEGGALACAILQEMTQLPAFTMVTTHLGVVKSTAHEHPHMLNAAVRFNTTTLEPEYVLELGQPGASHALNIARRLGLPDRILSAAQRMMNTDHLQLEDMLSKLEEGQRLVSEHERETEAAMSKAIRDRDQLREELEALRSERRRLLHDAYQQAASTVDNTRKQLENLLRQVKQSESERARNEAAKELRKSLVEKEQKIESALKQTAPRPATPLAAADLKEGAQVWVETLGGNGRIVTIPDDRRHVTVEVGRVRFTVKPRDLAAPRRGGETATEETAEIKVSRPRATGHAPTELHLLGCTVDEAEQRLDVFLDRAALAGLPELRVVHGFGTGRLQKGVHDYLRHHPLVHSFRLGKGGEDPGGGGVTLVYLQPPE